jgi:ABC-type nickel/cobalt efflux system permease component RcnA
VQNKFLNGLYWVLFLSVGLALLVGRYALAAFIALALIVIQLSEIATYLQEMLKKRDSGDADVP